MTNNYDVIASNTFICWGLAINDNSTYSTLPLSQLAVMWFYRINGGLWAAGGYSINSFVFPQLSGLEETDYIEYEFYWITEWTSGTYNQNDIVYYNGAIWACTTATTTDIPAVGSDWVFAYSYTSRSYYVANIAGLGNLDGWYRGDYQNVCTSPFYGERECGCYRVDLADYMTEESYLDLEGVEVNWNWAVAIITTSGTIYPLQFIDRNGGSSSSTVVEFCVPEEFNGEGSIRTIYTKEEYLEACYFDDDENPFFIQEFDFTCLNISFDLDVTGDCTSVIVKDTTDWESSSLEREDVGIALFSSTDNISWLGDLTNPGDNNNQSEWFVDALNQNTLYITSFYVPVWQAGLYLPHAIVYRLGVFYYNSSVGSTAGEPGISLDWTILTESDFGIFYNSVFNLGLEYWMYSTQVQLDCDLTQIWKQECYHYRVIPNLEDITIEIEGKTYLRNWEVSLYDVTGQTLLGCWVIDRNAGETYADIITPEEDGIYVVYIRYQAGPPSSSCTNLEDDIQIVHTYPIYEICDLQNCYMNLVNNLLCNEIDPCCETCDEDVLRQMDLQRMELNKMIALYFTLISMLNLERVNYLGVNVLFDINRTPVDMDRYNLIMKINDVITKLGEVVGRCGDCNGTEEDFSSPCKDC